MAYPNPCDQCRGEDCNKYRKCRHYHSWVNWNWVMFRGYAKRTKEQKTVQKKWVYQHPDRAREYLKKGPCRTCTMNGNCDDPCSAYWEWWDARMVYFRKVMGT